MRVTWVRRMRGRRDECAGGRERVRVGAWWWRMINRWRSSSKNGFSCDGGRAGVGGGELSELL